MSLSLSYPKRLIEVDLPIRAISEQARREKSIRHGHISTLHIWWARRPLAACRAVTCAALWPDPVDELCPQAFREAAALALCFFAAQVRSDATVAAICGKHAQERWFRLNPAILDARNIASRFDMRYALLDFIADFSNWDASTLPAFLEPARLLTHAAHLALSDPNWKLPVQWDRRDSFEGMRAAMQALEEALEHLPRPLVVDPFAGGGAIPLEALRVGADAFASDLNPVAVLLNKVALEYIPKYGNARIESKDAEGKPIVFNGLAEAVRYWGRWIKQEAKKVLPEFYPKDPDGATPIAYLWARTIRCEGPGCGAEVPLLRTLWLAKKSEGSVAFIIINNQTTKHISFRLIQKKKGKWFEKDSNLEVQDPSFEGTVKRGSATCPICGYTTPVARVRSQLKERNGGTRDAKLICVVTATLNETGRSYRIPQDHDFLALEKAQKRLEELNLINSSGIQIVPNEPSNEYHMFNNSAAIYGMNTWGEMFGSRQLLALSLLVNFTQRISNYCNDELEKPVRTIIALAVDRQADKLSSLASVTVVQSEGKMQKSA